MRLFISQPMKDKTDEEIKKVREEAIAYVKQKFPNENVEVIDSFFEGAPVGAKPLWFLSKSLELLSTADIVYFCKGWQDARGCKIERNCAEAYGISILEGATDKTTTEHSKNPRVVVQLYDGGGKLHRELKASYLFGSVLRDEDEHNIVANIQFGEISKMDKIILERGLAEELEKNKNPMSDLIDRFLSCMERD